MPPTASPAFVITCAFVRIVPSGETTKPEPWAPWPSVNVKTVTTPGERSAKMRAGEKADDPMTGGVDGDVRRDCPARGRPGHHNGRRASGEAGRAADAERRTRAEHGADQAEKSDAHAAHCTDPPGGVFP